MQLYAFNHQNALVLAKDARSKCDYFCLECHGIVRIRKGKLRKAHFYHISHTVKCSQQRKSLIHIALQEYLGEILPNAELEKRFPEIKRIADVAWLDRKIIFEIQCSPIEPEEVLARSRDYRSIGFEIVWILHDKRYNKWRHSLTEKALAGQPRYFTNFNQYGKGMIYDQFEIIQNGLRKIRLPALPVDVSQPFIAGKLGFHGDFLYHSIEKTSYFARAQQEERKRVSNPSLLRRAIRFLKDSYVGWLDRRLERCAIDYDM